MNIVTVTLPALPVQMAGSQVTDLQARLNECQDKLEASCEESSAMQSSAEASLNKVKAVSETLVGENAELVVANKAMTQQVNT